MSYITFKDLGKTGDTCSQIQQYASLYAVAKKNNKEIVFTESAYNAKCKHSTGEYEGFRFLNETPKIGADNKLIVFLHPKDTNGVLVEICQSR